VGDVIAFWILAPVSVVAAGGMVLSRKAIHSALWLVVNFFTLSVFFLILGSPFLFVVQIIVYAGAIMVLFLFVIMLLGVDRELPLTERIRGLRFTSIVLGIALIVGLFVAIGIGIGFARETLPDMNAVNRGGNVRALANVLFNRFFFPFELTSVLLIVAAIGAVMHGRRRISEEDTIDMPADESVHGEQPPDGPVAEPPDTVACNGGRNPSEVVPSLHGEAGAGT
jgi:NADH-quinone oxidoreductase subunit J